MSYEFSLKIYCLARAYAAHTNKVGMMMKAQGKKIFRLDICGIVPADCCVCTF